MKKNSLLALSIALKRHFESVGVLPYTRGLEPHFSVTLFIVEQNTAYTIL